MGAYFPDEPLVYFVGDERHVPQYGKKIVIDYYKERVRMSLIIKPEHNHPNIKKQEQIDVLWFDWIDPRVIFPLEKRLGI